MEKTNLCSACARSGSAIIMSKSQLKKSPEIRCCTSCVNDNILSKSVNEPEQVKQTNNLIIHKIPDADNPSGIKSSISSPLQKSLLLFKTKDEIKSKKRKLLEIDEIPSPKTDDDQSTDLSDNSKNDLIEKQVSKKDRNFFLSELVNLYSKYNPSKCEKTKHLNTLLDKHVGKEEGFIQRLWKKYKQLAQSTKKDENEDNLKVVSNKDISSKSKQEVSKKIILKCDKCDGNHSTDSCPHFKKSRDKHQDAQKSNKKGNDIGGSGGNVTIKSHYCKIISQPGDGSCLFHSMSYGLLKLGIHGAGGGSARKLRRDIAQFLITHPSIKISDTPVSSWIKWDSGMNVQKYCQRMSHGGWGGGIELAGAV